MLFFYCCHVAIAPFDIKSDTYSSAISQCRRISSDVRKLSEHLQKSRSNMNKNIRRSHSKAAEYYGKEIMNVLQIPKVR